jgi:hypothetical protein
MRRKKLQLKKTEGAEACILKMDRIQMLSKKELKKEPFKIS